MITRASTRKAQTVSVFYFQVTAFDLLTPPSQPSSSAPAASASEPTLRSQRSTRPTPYPSRRPSPRPTLETLPAQAGIVNRKRSEAVTRERWVECCKRRAKLWSESTPDFVLPSVSLAALESWRKNSNKDIAKAERQIRSMQDWPADACSGRWWDKGGNLLVAVFADQIQAVSYIG
jgi:hypothetical protein